MNAVAVVTRNEGPLIWVDYLGEAVPCRMRPTLRIRPRLVLGDEVLVERQPDGSYSVTSALPRRSGPIRLTRGRGKQDKVANVDQVVVVLNAGSDLKGRNPARDAQAKARVLLAVNKCDLEDEAVFRSRVAPWVEDGLEVVLTSALTGRGLVDLRTKLQGHVSAVIGSSGAGKTSLLEALYPGYRLREKASELYPLPGGGYLAV